MLSTIQRVTKRPFMILSLILAMGLASCSLGAKPLQRYEQRFFDLFNTASQIQGFAHSEAEFAEAASAIHEDLIFTHRLFNRHELYDDVKNIAYLNEHASEAPVPVDPLLFDLIQFSLDAYDFTNGAFHPGLGKATTLWETARDIQKPPPSSELSPILEHIDPAVIELDEAAKTVFFHDAEFELDLGAIAKGYAAEYVAVRAEERGASNILLNLGGNLRTIGMRDSDDSGEAEAWRIGIRDPRAEGPKMALNLYEGSLVTSGDYERVFTYEGKRYHHILDPTTLMPTESYQGVTIYHPDSGLADVLSTAFFNLSVEEGSDLVESMGGEAFWILSDGTEGETSGLTEMRSKR